MATMRHMDDSNSMPRSGKAPIQQRWLLIFVDLAAHVLGMHQFLGEQLDVHNLVIGLLREHLVPLLAVLRLQLLLGLLEAAADASCG